MKKVFLFVPALLLTLVVALSAPCLGNAGDAPSEDIKKAARDGIKFHLKDARIDQVGRSMGFESQDDIDTADLGEGFQIYTIDTNKLQDESIPQNFQTLVTSKNQWEFLVVASGKAKALLTVYSLAGEWKTGAVRSSELVKEMSGFLAAWPASAGYQYRFIRVYPISDYIELSQNGKVLGLFSLDSLTRKSGRTAGTFAAKDLLDPQEVLSKLRSSVKQNNESNKIGGTPSDDVKKASREGIKVHLKGRKYDKGFQDLGFKSQADIDNAEPGDGFQIFTIPTDKLLDESTTQDFQALVTPTNQWEFFVVANGKAKSFLRVVFVDGKWMPSGIGSSRLAEEMSGFLATWPASSGYQYRYVRVYPVAADFIELSQRGKIVGIIPLTYLWVETKGRTAGEFSPNDLRDPKEILLLLRPAAKQSIEMWKQMKQM